MFAANERWGRSKKRITRWKHSDKLFARREWLRGDRKSSFSPEVEEESGVGLGWGRGGALLKAFLCDGACCLTHCSWSIACASAVMITGISVLGKKKKEKKQEDNCGVGWISHPCRATLIYSPEPKSIVFFHYYYFF